MNTNFKGSVLVILATGWLALGGTALAEQSLPNILWLSAEDISPHLGCYGDPHAITPHLDQLATQGVRYTHAFTTAGVCAPCRSGIITGMYQTTLGTQHMRCQATLPSHIQPFPAYLREAGYYCTNNSKQDYQFITPPETWDKSSSNAHWRGRNPEQPFFAVFNFSGCHEGGIARDKKYEQVTANLRPEQRQDAAKLTTLPPYYPDTPITREDWKRNYELITAMDAWAGKLIAQLKDDGLYEDTIIMFWSDHGVGLPRAKRWLYDSGTHVPLIARIPEKFRTGEQDAPGTVVEDLVSSIDFGPTVLNLAGLEVPTYMQGQPFLGKSLPQPRNYVYGARDRMDERYDIIRMVRDKRYKYLRNYEPQKPYYQWMETPEKGATMRELRRVHAEGKLPEAAELFFAKTKPAEELYDTTNDPHELNNLAGDPHHSDVLQRLRAAQLAWAESTLDLGLVAEPILATREQQISSRYEMLRQANGAELAARIRQAAVAASLGESAKANLAIAAIDADPAVRYWGAIGLGNLSQTDDEIRGQLKRLLDDPSNAVRLAAARGLCRTGSSSTALNRLAEVLTEGSQWERLQAAIALDELDQQAAAVVEPMRAALTPRTELYSKGKYTVRVIHRALAELEPEAP
ncbi:sulfatase-like hydrolase/transferase [Adhaeretor mobilis]|uniref:Sulfatase n=1 Tax=Adhaeretor mobilis TaxID=1930276 RepID=A0A517MTF2_9BACT|nr:sulfatase-like hydrolase/transferase [Adhaeretor mobilis]QDS98163.1 Sulfatase [Adhaeretor mobilis]